jgi:hydroxymethylpyrimidine pyrophosphatase-like HAD family hydrolase
LDGVVIPLKQNALPSQKVVRAIARAKQCLKIGCATGRPITNSFKIIKKLGLQDPCIIAGGTQIINPKTGRILWEMRISKKNVQTVLLMCLPYPYEILLGNEVGGQGAQASQRGIPESTNVMYIMNTKASAARTLLRRFKKIKGIRAIGVNGWTPHHIDIHVTHQRATKEHAMKIWKKLLHLNKKEVIAIGDDINDIPLFKGAGLKVAMGNAVAPLKEHADRIIGSVSENGVATFLDELCDSR